VRDELLANQAVLLRRCDDFEVDLAQAKRKAATDAGVIEYLRKQVLDLQEAARTKVRSRAWRVRSRVRRATSRARWERKW